MISKNSKFELLLLICMQNSIDVTKSFYPKDGRGLLLLQGFSIFMSGAILIPFAIDTIMHTLDSCCYLYRMGQAT